MPTPGVNIAVNQLFASGTYGWRKDKLGSSFGFPTDDDGVTWGIPVWSNTLGTGPAAGGTRRLISQTSAFSKPAVDDGEQPIYGGTTPGDSPYCGITYIHDGAGFNVGPGEVWKFSCTISRLSYQDSIEFDIASWRNWGALAAVSPKLAQLWMHNGDFQQRYDDYIAASRRRRLEDALPAVRPARARGRLEHQQPTRLTSPAGNTSTAVPTGT